ncbi:MAG: GNAT family N-acetyltransferase [Dehalococcoidia bacterium]|nr:GNAT family N-acetyltransferase [Dehalococcoidia bacterium]
MANVRLATEEDIHRILGLYHELTIHLSQVEMSRSPSPDDVRKVFAEICADPRHELSVAEEGGEVVGTVILLIVPNLSHSATPWALVENLIVGEKYRREGYGRMLLEHVIARAKEKGCHRIELCSDLRRKEAHQLYSSVGFEASAYGFRIYF